MCWIKWKILSVNPWPSELNQLQATRLQPQSFPLGWGCAPPILAGKPRGTRGKVCSSWLWKALCKPSQEPFPLGACMAFPKKVLLHSFGAIPAQKGQGYGQPGSSNISWPRSDMVGQEGKISPSTETTAGMKTWMDRWSAPQVFSEESATWTADLNSLQVMLPVMQEVGEKSGRHFCLMK